MAWQLGLTIAVVGGTVVVLARELVAPSVALMGATVTLLVAGVITPEEALAGFANPAPITVAALYVVAAAVLRTGMVETVIARALRRPASLRRQLTRVVVPTLGSSALLNNTAIVAMVAPAVNIWAQQRGIPASRFLIPVSYAAILGGVITAIGTSTNLVVSGLLADDGQAALGLFELTRAGLPMAVTGGLLLVLLSPRLLPDRRAARQQFADSIRKFTVTMEVVPEGPFDGRSVADGGLRALEGVYLVSVLRDGTRSAPVGPEHEMRGGDELTFAGAVDQVVDLHRMRGLRPAAHPHLEALGRDGQRFFEAVVGARSPMVGSTLKESEFRGRYGAGVVAIHRGGEELGGKLGDVRLRAGDALLVLAAPGWRDRWRNELDFALVGGTGAAGQMSSRDVRIVLVVTAGLIALAGTGVVPILEASLVAAFGLVGLGVLAPGQARAAVDLDVIVTIAAAFGVGAAIEASGLAALIADGIASAAAPLGPLGVLAGVLLATMLLTEALSNNAAAALMFPVAMAAAAVAESNPRPFAVAVAFAASLSFLTPIGYQTNLMVYGLGGYRFSDFTRIGIPLTLAMFLLELVLIPLAWPL